MRGPSGMSPPRQSRAPPPRPRSRSHSPRGRGMSPRGPPPSSRDYSPPGGRGRAQHPRELSPLPGAREYRG